VPGVRSLAGGEGARRSTYAAPVPVDPTRELAAAVWPELGGRPLVVVSSDREVADDVRQAGARPVPSRALLALLERLR